MVRREARRVSTITAETSLRQAQMRNKSGMSEEQAPGQLFITLGEPPHPNLGREADDPSARLLMPMALFSIPPLFAALLGGWVAGRFSTRRGFGRLAQES